MSKIVEALKKSSEERSRIISPINEQKIKLSSNTMEGKMRKSWLVWGIVVIIVTMFFVFNYQEGRNAVPLSEIFPDEEVLPMDVEYEFVQEKVLSNTPKEEVKAVPEKAPVEVAKETKEQPTIAMTPEPAKELPAYTIQIASFKDKKRAEEALKTIRQKVPSAYVASRDLREKGVWYRIYAGQFNLRNEAEVTLNDIKRNYDSSFIISPKGLK